MRNTVDDISQENTEVTNYDIEREDLDSSNQENDEVKKFKYTHTGFRSSNWRKEERSNLLKGILTYMKNQTQMTTCTSSSFSNLLKTLRIMKRYTPMDPNLLMQLEPHR